MARATYAEIPGLVRRRESFDGNSLSAIAHGSGEYVVASYGTAIGRIDREGVARINVSKYSSTTSRGQNILRRAWPDAELVRGDVALY